MNSLVLLNDEGIFLIITTLSQETITKLEQTPKKERKKNNKKVAELSHSNLYTCFSLFCLIHGYVCKKQTEREKKFP
jgi:hypothetical protein